MMRGLIGPLAWTTQMRALGIRHALAATRFVNLIVPPLMAAMNIRMAVEDAITPDAIREDNACIYVAWCRKH